MHTHKQAYIYVGEVWRGIQLTVSHSYLQWRFDFTDLICALPMLGGSQDWINDHPPALTLSFHLIVSQWVSQHLIFPLGTSACTPPPSPLFSLMCAHSAEPFFSFLICVLGVHFWPVLLISLWPMISCLKNKQLGPNKNCPREFGYHSTDQRKKMDGFQPWP